MTVNEAQRDWLLRQGHISADILEKALQSLPPQSEFDLCELLFQRSLLNHQQSDYVREQVNLQFQRQTEASPESFEISNTSEFNATSSDIPGYKIMQTLGHGGMGVVYKGIQEATGAEVVIKNLLKDRVSAEAATRFHREAQVLAQFSHQNIVTIRDFGENQGYPYIVMGFVEGMDLKQVLKASLKSKPLGLDWILPQIKTLAKALAVCHEKGIVHRDLKPSNIMIENETDRPVIIDFGLASAVDGIDGQSLVELTKTGAMLGTPAFMAPEQFDKKSSEQINDKADVWGLGATLFYCLTGQPPFIGDSPFAIYKKLIENPAPLPSALNKSVPPWVDTLCKEMLNKKADQRPSMTQVVTALENEQRSSRKPIAICSFTLVLLSMLLGGLWYFSQNQDRTPPLKPKILLESHITANDLNNQTVVFTREDTLSLSIQSHDENPGSILALNTETKEKIRGKLQEFDRFTVKFPVRPGKNQFIVKAVDRFKNVSQPEILVVIRDALEPKVVSWTLPETIDFQSQIGFVQFNIAGTVNEDACTVSFGSEQARMDGRKFKMTVTFKGAGKKLNLTIKDRVGNSAIEQIPIGIVSTTKGTTHTHKTIASVLRNAPNARRIFVRPGEYRDTLRLSKSVDIVGIGAAPVIIIPSRGPALKIDKFAEDPKVRLKNIQLKIPDSSEEYLFLVETGTLNLESCLLRSGKRGIGQCFGTKEESRQPKLSLKDCTIRRRGPIGIVVERAELNIVNSQFFDQQASGIPLMRFQVPNGRSVYFQSATLQIGRDGTLFMEKSHFHAVKNRHIFVTGGKAVLKDSRFDRSVHEGLFFGENSTGQLLRIESSSNTEEFILARDCRKLVIEHCEIRDGGFGNTLDVDEKRKIREPIPRPAIKIERSLSVTIRHSRLMNYMGGGILISGKLNMTLTIEDSQVMNHSFSGIEVHGCTLEMKNCKLTGNSGNGVFASGARLNISGGQISHNKDFGLQLFNKSVAKLSKALVVRNLKGDINQDDSSKVQNK